VVKVKRIFAGVIVGVMMAGGAAADDPVLILSVEHAVTLSPTTDKGSKCPKRGR
jgi:hypothetical protein